MEMALELLILIMFRFLIKNQEIHFKDKFNTKLLIQHNISTALILKTNLDKL